jgi:hypothetical protein
LPDPILVDSFSCVFYASFLFLMQFLVLKGCFHGQVEGHEERIAEGG